MFQLDNQPVRLAHVNIRTEQHGAPARVESHVEEVEEEEAEA